MKKLLIAVLLNAVLLQIAFADSGQAANRYVEYWNMGVESGWAIGSELLFGRSRKVTIRLDKSTIEYFRKLSEEVGVPYQSLINLYPGGCAVQRKSWN